MVKNMEKEFVLSKAQVARVAKQNGNLKIGTEAVEKLTELAEAYIKAIANDAAKLAAHANRKVVKVSDITLAIGEE